MTMEATDRRTIDMDSAKYQRQIDAGTAKTGKTYGFDETHDPRVHAQHWFQSTPEGELLFIVFYTQACRWSRCLGCNLPSKMSRNHVWFGDIMAQVDHLLSLPEIETRKGTITRVLVSNNGSVLDEATFSSTALIYLVAKLNMTFPRLEVLTLETRPEFVEIEELDFLSRALAEGETPTTLELGVGFEAFDDCIRNEVFNKGLALEVFERLAGMMGKYGFRLKCYFMLKPVPGMTAEEAVADIHRGIEYLQEVSDRTGARVSMHLNPTYAATGTPLETALREGRFSPPTLIETARAALHAKGRGIPVYLGLSDEGLACPGGSFVREGDGPAVETLERFNRTGDFSILEGFLAASDKGLINE